MECTHVWRTLAVLALAGALGSGCGDAGTADDTDGDTAEGDSLTDGIDVPPDTDVPADGDAPGDDDAPADDDAPDGDAPDDGTDGICLCASDPDCDDGLSCNGEEVCLGCLCVAGDPLGDGTACDDGDPCTDGETCGGGVCGGGTPSCACAIDSDCAPFEDGDLCNGTLICSASHCVLDPGSVVSCDPTWNTDCLVNRCAAGTGLCGMAPAPDGLSCDDGNGCTVGEACDGGSCTGGVSTCECTGDADCAPFEDGDLCNGTLACASNACVVDPATIVACDPAAPACRVNVCAPATGACAPAPVVDGTSCDDGSACTLGDACSAGSCSGAARACADGNVCTDDSCDPASGCVFANNVAPCDDGDACTVPDVCRAGACVGTPTGLTNCDGVCVDIGTDPANCGGCGRPCLFDERCSAGSCSVRAWETVGDAVNPPALAALAHALGTDGTGPWVVWVADQAPQDAVYAHRLSGAAWNQVGLPLTSGANMVQPVVDIQFNGTTPNTLHVETLMTGENLHVKAYSGVAWNEVGAPGHRAACGWLSAAALALQGAVPHVSYLGAGGCGIGNGYSYWTGAIWWMSPAPPSPMPGLLTMFGGGNTDVAFDGTRALVALMDRDVHYVRYWNSMPPVGWVDLGGPLNVGVSPSIGPWSQNISLAIGPGDVPYVAWAETTVGVMSVYVKRYDSGTGWALLGAGKISGAGNADFPSIAVVGGMPHVAFVEDAGGVGQIRVRRWNGATWQRVGAPLNNDLAVSAAGPYLVGIAAVPYVAFREPPAGANGIYVKRLP